MSALLDAVTYKPHNTAARIMRLDTLRAFLMFWKDVPAYELAARPGKYIFGMNLPLVEMDARVWTQDPTETLKSVGTVIGLIERLYPGLGDALEGEGPLPTNDAYPFFLSTSPLEALFAPNMNTVVRVSGYPFPNNAGVGLYLSPSVGGEPLSSLSPWPASLPTVPGSLPTTTLPSIPSLPSVQLPGWLQPQATPAPAAPAAAPASEFPLWGKVAIGAVLAGAAWYLVKPKRYVANADHLRKREKAFLLQDAVYYALAAAGEESQFPAARSAQERDEYVRRALAKLQRAGIQAPSGIGPLALARYIDATAHADGIDALTGKPFEDEEDD